MVLYPNSLTTHAFTREGMKKREDIAIVICERVSPEEKKTRSLSLPSYKLIQMKNNQKPNTKTYNTNTKHVFIVNERTFNRSSSE